MKIVIIASYYPPYELGGGGIYVERIAKDLEKAGNKVTIITTNIFNNLDSFKLLRKNEKNIAIYRFYPFNVYANINAYKKHIILKIIWHLIDLWNIHSYFTIKKILKKEKPDVVHTHNLGGLSAGATFRAIKNLNLPLVHTCHDHAILCPYAVLLCPFWKGESCKYPKFPCEIYRKIKRKIIHDPDIVTAPSQFVLNNHTVAGFFKGSKKIVIPLGIELDKFNNLSDNGKAAENFNILYVGGLSKIKGVHILIEVFKKIFQVNVKLHIVGGGDYASTLKGLAKNDNRIIFYGKLPNQEVQRFYKESDVVVVPSICYENSPTVIYESFRAGTPVISSNIGGIPELIKDNHNGFLFEAGNIIRLREILENIIENPEQLKDLSKNAFEAVKQYDMNKHIGQLIKIYKEAIELNNLKDDK
ncbi:hypothetical protein BEH94_07780 [Candidatus Altiarchaeales archaeon WOR_SM1_SCG]|nr:hypothetical protein BEH94_07780 [Candidatus Altiarchaeales archaeon WOR_SM1_SCG]